MQTKTLKWQLGFNVGLLGRRSVATPYRIQVVGDPFAPGVSRALQDYVYAIVASRGTWRFLVTTAYPARLRTYLASVEKRSVGAAERYRRKMVGHFRKYRQHFREGYSLPSPPTPQLRVIYDSAAKTEGRPTLPCGTTLQSGFSLGEYHWREWPLTNLRYVEDNAP